MTIITKVKVLLLVLGIAVVVPLSNAGRPLAVKDTKFTAKDVECLALNIYMEARGEPWQGQIAVAQVTLNRLHAKKYGNSICQIVYAKSQFSWTEGYTSGNKNYKQWKNSLAISRAVLSGELRLPNFNAKYFHNKTVKPKWAKNKILVATIANHRFYT